MPYTVLGLSRCAFEMIGPRSGSLSSPCWKNIAAWKLCTGLGCSKNRGFLLISLLAELISVTGSWGALAKYSASLQSQAKAPDIPSRSLRASKHELSASLNAQAQAPDDPYPLHPHGAPREFVLASSVFKRVLPRFYTKCHSHPSFHYVSHDHSHLLTRRSFKQSYVGIVRFEVFVRHLRIRIVIQGVAVFIVLAWVTACLIACVSPLILVVTLYISFRMYHLSMWHMMCVHFESFIGLLCIIVLAWHIFPWLSPFVIRL